VSARRPSAVRGRVRRRASIGRRLAATAGVLALLAGAGSAHAADRLKVERDQLPNGIRLVLAQQSAVPIVALTCLVDGGARVDPPDRPGLAAFTATMLEEGTANRSSQEIARLVDSLGGSLDIGAGTDWITAAVAVLAKDWDQGVDLVAESLLHPAFRTEDIERIRAETLGELQAAEDNPGYVAGRAFRSALFGAGPYGHTITGQPESVRAITREELVAFHAGEIRPERTICVAVGDVPTARMREVLAKRLGEWKASGTPRPVVEEPPPAPGRVLVDKPISQANIIVGQIGVARSSPDYFAIQLMNHILGGGGFTSRLMRIIRTEGGLAYSVDSSFASTRLPGPFQVVLQTKVESAGEAIALVHREIRRLHDEGPTQEELDQAKDFLTGSFPLRLDSIIKLAGYLAQVEYFGLGEDYIDTYADRVRAVTLEQVATAARERLHPDRLVEVVVGPEKAIAPLLK
jgi:zinc protease